MEEIVFLVHGWSVTETSTYQALHEKLDEHGFFLDQIYLGRYVSLDDMVEIKDLAAAMHNALIDKMGKPPWRTTFHIITHSTGALITKEWILNHYEGNFAKHKPLANVVFLAGPHFGSRLAHHGRSMIAQAIKMGQTGKNILKALELGSTFSWENNMEWIDKTFWKGKGIRPYCLIGDKVTGSKFSRKIFGAGFEKGSDMVVRVPAANLNFNRFTLDSLNNKLTDKGGISGVPFAVLKQYTHSGKKHGIMNSITRKADPVKDRYQNLRLIIDCLNVDDNDGYEDTFKYYKQINKQLMGKPKNSKKPYAGSHAQLDFYFRDNTGAPIEDYTFTLGAFVNGKPMASNTVKHIHKNKIDASHLTAFLDLKEFEPNLTYFMKFDTESGTDHFHYEPDPYELEINGSDLKNILVPNQTTQIEVILERVPGRKLFVFHQSDESNLHVKWNRDGEITDDGIDPE